MTLLEQVKQKAILRGYNIQSLEAYYVKKKKEIWAHSFNVINMCGLFITYFNDACYSIA